MTDPYTLAHQLNTLCSYVKSYLDGVELFALIISNTFNDV